MEAIARVHYIEEKLKEVEGDKIEVLQLRRLRCDEPPLARWKRNNRIRY